MKRSLSRPVRYQKRENPNTNFCCVPQCAMSGKFNSSVSFHNFPKDETLRNVWIHNVRRDNLVIKSTTKVCSRHFVSTDVIQGGRQRLKEEAVPVLFAWNDYFPPAAVWERAQRPEDELIKEEETDVESLLQIHNYCARPEPSALDPACEKIEAQQLVTEEQQQRLEEVTLKQSFGLERFLASDDDIRFYTRFASYRHLQAFWRLIEPTTRRIVRAGTQPSTSSMTAAPDKAGDPPSRQPHQSRCLPMIDELFLFLMYLSLGLKEEDLGDRFNVDQSTVSRIIKTWVHFLYTLLGAVGIWMSPESIRATMPSVFGKYSDTQVLIDCTEMRCQMPSSLLPQRKMYKSHTTLKGMIGVSPHGAVTFVSSLYPGSVSDKELFRQSGIIPLLDKDMAVMVDKGFKIDDLVPCKVYRPPFLSKKSQLSHDEVLVTQDIERLRIHVERTIRHIRDNKLFDTIIPLTVAGRINQLFAVACLLTNYQNKPLVKAWAKELTMC